MKTQSCVEVYGGEGAETQRRAVRNMYKVKWVTWGGGWARGGATQAGGGGAVNVVMG